MWHAYLQTKEYPVHQPTVSGMFLGPAAYADPPDPSTSIPVVAPVVFREKMMKFPLIPSIWIDLIKQLATWVVIAVQPNTDAIWIEKETSYSSQWAELRTLWLVITHELWL